MATSTNLTPFTARPDFGAVGRKHKVDTNHWRFSDIPDITIYQYSIEIIIKIRGEVATQKLPVKAMRQIFATKVVQDNLGSASEMFIFDGRTMGWSKHNIHDFSVTFKSDARKEITVKLTSSTSFKLGVIKAFILKRVEMSTTVIEAITFLNHLVAARPTETQIAMGRNFFTNLAADTKQFDGPIEFRRGLFQAVHFGGTTSLTLNVDVTTAVFWKSTFVTVIDLVAEVLHMDRNDIRPTALTQNQYRYLSRLLKGLKFFVRHLRDGPRFYSIHHFTNESSIQHTFSQQNDATSITVQKYYQKTYNRALQYPQANLVTNKKESHYPMELCYLDTRYNAKLDAQQCKDMIGFAGTKPNVRKQNINSKKRSLAHEKDKYLQAYGIKVDSSMMQVDARQLPEPSLAFGNSGIRVGQGDWDYRKAGTTIIKWGVLCFNSPANVSVAVNNFISILITAAGQKNMRITATRPLVVYENPNTSETINARLDSHFRQFKAYPPVKVHKPEENNIELLLVVTPSATSEIYAPVKRYCDSIAGVASQCIARANLDKPHDKLRQLALNLLMKINSKLGGVNVSLRELPPSLRSGTVFFGADVSHPAPGAAPTRASLATMTGSLDALASRYAAVAKNQAQRQEVITEAQKMAKVLLGEYRKSTNSVPRRIIYIRDGVSEGQYAEVLRVEVAAIRQAAREVTGTNQAVTITVIIAKKRHHTRIFPSSQHPSQGDRNMNVFPGTVVDTGITHPVEFDFFLVPHKAFQGTVRPVHYHVIHDENKFKSDELQTLIYHQCYAYARSSTAVSLRFPPDYVFLTLDPAVYYAHLAGNRARVRDEQWDCDDDNISVAADPPPTVPKLRDLHPALKGGRLAMWFL